MIPALLIPIITQLASKGLDLIGSAVLAKGKDVVEKELGVNLEDSLSTDAGTEALRQAQMVHEEKLLELALEDRKLDQNYFKLEVEDTDSARKREIAIATSEQAGWLNQNLVPILALLVIIGGGGLLMVNSDTDVKFAVTGMMTLVLGYYFGKSSSEWRKDSTISRLTDKV